MPEHHSRTLRSSPGTYEAMFSPGCLPGLAHRLPIRLAAGSEDLPDARRARTEAQSVTMPGTEFLKQQCRADPT